MMIKSSPHLLPPVTSVDVVILRKVFPNGVERYMQCASDAPSVTLRGDEAQRIADLWRQLPPGTGARCHTPPYGVRFRADEQVLCEASLCWECDNIFGNLNGQHLIYEFDGQDPISRELLGELRRAVGESETA